MATLIPLAVLAGSIYVMYKALQRRKRNKAKRHQVFVPASVNINVKVGNDEKRESSNRADNPELLEL